MDYNIITNVTRMEFFKLFPYYAKGTYMSIPGIEKIIHSGQAKRIVITPNEGTMRLCADGEITDAGRVEMEIQEKAFTFLVPILSRKEKGGDTDDTGKNE